MQQHGIAIIFMDRYVGVFIDKQKIRMGKQNIKHKYASLCGVIIYQNQKDKAACAALSAKVLLLRLLKRKNTINIRTGQTRRTYQGR
ncbi:hypothetical protein WI664_03110, partial [Vibrio cholerae]